MSPTERELRSLFLSGLDGDSNAYRKFLRTLSVVLRVYVQRQLARTQRPGSDAEDIVQEALIAIHTRRHTYERDLPVTAWAYAIARYKLIDMLRASSNERQIAALEDMDFVVDDRDQVEAAILVRKGVAALPATLRLPIEMIKLHGFSAKDVADKTGTSETTVRVNVHRGLKALARMCRGEGKGSK